jgi:hypothetical protein
MALSLRALPSLARQTPANGKRRERGFTNLGLRVCPPMKTYFHPFDASSIVPVVVPYPIHPLSLLLSATEWGKVEIVVRAD